jgi:hypothetical protein
MSTNGINGIHHPSTAGAPSRITLSLGHLPSKKDIKAPWPRTPTRVGFSFFYPAFFALTQRF